MNRNKTGSKFHHLALAVSDLERSIYFYCQIIGFQIIENYSWGLEGNFLDQMLGAKLISGKAVMVGSGNAFLELFEYEGTREVSKLEKPVHFCIYTDDIENLYQKVSEYGAGSLHPPMNTQLGTSLAFIKDPDGYLIELLQIYSDTDVLNFGTESCDS
ncbi:MAG: VOC family protein [Alphaproteobacteria bacterium]|nr:MAG: VOC family protein [Alphaproteobacteria bacterium]